MYTTPRTKAGRLKEQAAAISKLIDSGTCLNEFGNLKILRWEGVSRDKKQWFLRVYKGNAAKAYIGYCFRTSESRSDYVKRLCEAESQQDDAKAARYIKQKADTKNMRSSIAVGTILHNSWGYDQTNCDYYQVVALKGTTMVIIREIASKSVEGSGGFMCTQLKPVPNEFIGAPISRKINAYGVNMEFGSATPVNPSDSHYSSWYA